jgi:hypothetical protein
MNERLSDIPVRYGTPTQFDPAPYGTIIILKIDDATDMWIQSGTDTDKPEWMRFGVWLEGIFINEPAVTEVLRNIVRSKMAACRGSVLAPGIDRP